MAFTPYSTPIQYEYKPLNLAAFAVPLGKMQEQLDLTKAAISTTDFDLAHLPYGSDPERAKELIATARAKRDELAKNLMETKNYRQAAIKLHELNKTWKLDPEKSALESNYKLWQERDKAERERIDNGKDNQITRDQYLQWRNDEIRKYETGNVEGKTGTGFKASYEKPEGDYKIITGQTGRLSDLEEELDSKVLEVASKLNSDSFESALRAVGIDQDTQHKLFKKDTTEELTKEKVANAVRGYLLTQPRFRDWGTEVAKYDFKDMLHSDKYSEYAQSIIQNSLSDVDSKIAAREKRLKEVQGNKDKDPIYQRLLEEKNELLNASAGGEYDPKIVEREYIDQHLNKMYDMSAVGKVMEFKKVSTEDVARAIPKEDDGGGANTLIGAGDVLVTPNKFETFSVNTINSTIYKNAKEMLPQLAKIGDLAGGAARTIFLGQQGSETRTKNSNNPGLYRDRIERGLSIFTDLKNRGVTNSTEFYKALNRAGILATQADAKKLWNDWSAPNSGSLTTTKKILEQTAQSALDYQDAKNLHNNILEGLKESQDVKKIVGENANSYFSITGSLTANQIKKIEKLGAGITVTEDGYTIIKATLNQMAKLNGYANAQQAVEKGFNFYGLKLFKGKNTNEYMQQLLEEGLVKKELSQRLTGNKDIDTYVNNQFLNASDLSTFKPAFGSWDFEIFDEKGNIKAGVTLDLSGTRSAHMNFHGNTTYFEAPVKVRTEDGKIKEKMAYVIPKTGSQAFIQRALNFATDITEGKVDVLQKQTNDVVRTYSFNNRFKNTLSSQTFESTEVGKGGSIPLMSISDIAPGVNVVVKKEYPSWKEQSGKVHYGEDPVMYIYLNGSKVIDPETGKPFYTTKPDAVKAFLDEAIAK